MRADEHHPATLASGAGQLLYVAKLLDLDAKEGAVTFAGPAPVPREGEWVVRGGSDKFIGSDLEQRLKDRGVKTVIVTGTSAQGAVAGTSNGAVQRGYKAVVPVDGMSAGRPV
jgi:nicotinamidase-related amidase